MDRPSLRDPINDALLIVLAAVCLYLLLRTLI